MHLLIFSLLILCLAACAQAETIPEVAVVPTESPRRATQIAAAPVLSLGQQQYDLRCAHCHGYSGEGQLPQTIENTLSLGMNLIPAHDATGHTWKHPDQLLIRVIKDGISNPLNQFTMEPYAGVMTDVEINAVLMYIKLWWTDEQRAYQNQLTARWAELQQQLGSG